MKVHFERPVFDAIVAAKEQADKDERTIKYIQLDYQESLLFWEEMTSYRASFSARRRFVRGVRVVLDGETYNG